MDEQDNRSGQLINNKGEINRREVFYGNNTTEAARESVVPNHYRTRIGIQEYQNLELEEMVAYCHGMPEHLLVPLSRQEMPTEGNNDEDGQKNKGDKYGHHCSIL
ncbi:hypothetical protein Nepgr_021231 [Nepenthes gracilis]|uniref:Uncharacterized protein n=1 Tax=Nepenthes gracilis TaxID=150966 RepID=A0AAD3SY99_NEPGR|nr:hypothetical protein Nepgr_021231 [Nepenthes gracilis]